ncbi:MAG: hypothetical protein Sapg2KO_52430 [Saprospiraceae bacterium]
MKNFLLLFLIFLSGGALFAQTIPEGINFQSLFRNEDGSPMVNQRVAIEISLTSGEELPEVYYQELHDLTTNELGLLNILIGKGQYPLHKLTDVPWEKGDIWLSISILENGLYREVIKNELLAVPYAMHARSTEKLSEKGELSLRSDNSIYWLTSGNAKSVPHVHFIGTNDELDFYIKTNNSTRYLISKDGLITLHAEHTNIEGSDESVDSYPLVITRAKHGFYIDLSVDRVDSGNNFVTFADSEDIHGAVEGQTLAECFADPFYIIDKILKVAELVKAGLDAASQFSEAASVSSDAVGAPAAPGAIINGGAQIANAIYLVAAEVRDLVLKILDNGVSYSSGGADYAEWLPKENSLEDFVAGQVIGVKNGQISLKTKDADHLMVISTNPILLGNKPEVGTEHLFEKVAFMGQVYVMVLGNVHSGDYILPSGNNDGFAIAVKSTDMQTGDFQNIIGVAWEDSKAAKVGLSHFVKVAVGINSNDLSDKLADLEIKADQIVGYLKGENAMPSDDFEASLMDKVAHAQGQLTTELRSDLDEKEYGDLLESYRPFLEETYNETGKLLNQSGVNLIDYPGLENQFNDPVGYLKALKKDPRYTSQIAALELALQRGQ